MIASRTVVENMTQRIAKVEGCVIELAKYADSASKGFDAVTKVAGTLSEVTASLGNKLTARRYITYRSDGIKLMYR